MLLAARMSWVCDEKSEAPGKMVRIRMQDARAR